MKKRNNVLSNARGHWVLIIFILFGILFLVKNVFFNKNYSDEIIVLEKPKTYDLKLSSKALVIKDEYLYYLGKSDIEVDSSKVNVDKEIGEVDVSQIDSNFKDYLAEKVETLKKQSESKETNTEKIDLENILKFIRDKNFSKTFDILSSEQNKIAFGKKYSSDKLFRYSLLNDTINSGKIVSKNSGIVLKKIDGLENVYDFSVIDSIDEKDFNFDSSDNISNIEGIKIVDNLKYYLCIRLKTGALDNIAVNNSIKVNIGDSIATGIIKNIKSGSEYDLIVAEFSSAFNEVADKRFIDLNVVKSVTGAFELPSSALTSKDGENYVLTVDSFNNIKRSKVVIKFIDKINSKVYIDSVNSSIGIFSNILKDASKIKEGAILK
ncbi:HlyD family efflux transporter periplasmic adaptor subunit [uncultured Parvimonas sp.]|uniref:HlyD family efflux transporter periplasmic adaptor subunit n=1 Tax=uncultured Parvimonas sp. TaxID=747372 RepID=UPI002595F719|nr:HlyD family efflux transporter periplasmic adaptor subunit [uncultured Parvimonas sp.]